MNEELHICFEGVRDSQNAARAHYQIWFTLRGKGKAIDTYLDDMNDTRYVDFFHANNSGNYKLMFIETACMFDPDDRTNSFRALKEQLVKNGFDEFAERITKELEGYKDVVSNIITIRSKVIAHKQAYLEPGELYEKHGITPNKIRDLLNTTAQLLLELETELTGCKTTHSVCTTDRWEDATFNLLSALKNERNS